MSALTAAQPAPRLFADGRKVSFGGVLRSERIKLFSLRSTLWCLTILVALNVALAGLVAYATSDDYVPGSSAGFAFEQAAAVQTITVGILLSALVSCTLGALVITGEYATGMIRSTFAAVPSRVPALLAKMIVLGVVTFMTAAVSVAIAAPVAAAVMTGNGQPVDLSDPQLWTALLGAAGYLALVGMLALAVGAIIRNSAGAITAVVGLVLVVPTVLGAIAELTRLTWLTNASSFLPSAAGGRMSSYPIDQPAGSDVLQLAPWQGGLVMGAWVLVAFVLAAVLVRKRDA